MRTLFMILVLAAVYTSLQAHVQHGYGYQRRDIGPGFTNCSSTPYTVPSTSSTTLKESSTADLFTITLQPPEGVQIQSQSGDIQHSSFTGSFNQLQLDPGLFAVTLKHLKGHNSIEQSFTGSLDKSFLNQLQLDPSLFAVTLNHPKESGVEIQAEGI
ncbi:hypothetical protein V8E54_002926 [Elaphomyces granulatus]